MSNQNGSDPAFMNEVFIVDDTVANLKLLSNILKTAGFEVRPASGGSIALRSIQARLPGLILLDINMPDMDGFEVCRRLKADEKTASIPIIFVSASNDEENILKGFQMGGVDYITKPFNEEEVIARVKAHLNLRIAQIELGRRNYELKMIKSNLEEEVKRRTSELLATNQSLEKKIEEKRIAEEIIRQQLNRVAALVDIDHAITSTVDLHLILDILLKHVSVQLGVDAACILLINPASNYLESAAIRGFRTDRFLDTHVRIGEDYAGHVASSRELLQVIDMNRPPNILTPTMFAGEDFVSYFGAPLIAKGELKGVLEVFNRAKLIPDQAWLDFFSALAGQASIAIDGAVMFDSLQRSNADLNMAYEATIEGWARALDMRDRETDGHTHRVTNLTVNLARLFGLTETEIIQIRRGALLHDIGKMGIPDSVLLKPEPLTDDDWVVMKKHPMYAYDLLSPITYLRPALDIPYYHHEKWDGSGYPRGLKGDLIPIAARIFAVVDAWDILTSERPYRKAWTKEKALEQLQLDSGTQYDPEIVKLFLKSKLYEL